MTQQFGIEINLFKFKKKRGCRLSHGEELKSHYQGSFNRQHAMLLYKFLSDELRNSSPMNLRRQLQKGR